MQEQLQEQLRKQQEVIENLQQQKTSEFTVPQKPMRKQGFKVYSEENSMEAHPSGSILDDTKALLQKDPLGGSGSVSGSGLASGSQHKTPPRIELTRMISDPSPTINTKEARMLVNQMWSEQKPAKPAKFEIFQGMFFRLQNFSFQKTSLKFISNHDRKKSLVYISLQIITNHWKS